MNKLAEIKASDRVKNIPEALSVYMNNVVYALRRKGEEVQVLSLGEAFFDIPMFEMDEKDFKRGYHYSESMGTLELREIIAGYYQKSYGAKIDSQSEILISAGSKALIFMAFQALLNDGDEVLIHEPAWLSYPEQVKLAGGVPRYIPYDCPIEEFSDYITAKTKMLVICNPNNPCGRVYARHELDMLYKICRPRGIVILVDEAYSDFVSDGLFTSMTQIVQKKDGIVVVNSLSKNLGISGWRVGYIISTPEIIYNVLKLNQHLITCPATVLLLYLEKYFHQIIKVTSSQIKAVVKKRNDIVKYIQEIGLTVLNGCATFYIFMDIGQYKYSSLELGLYLLTKYHISVVPGCAYGKSTARFVRISVGVTSIEDIKRALDVIKKVIDNNEYDEKYVDGELNKLGMPKF